MKTENQNQTTNSATAASASAPKSRRMRRSRRAPSSSLSQQGTTIREANVSNGETNSWRAREATGLGEGFSTPSTEGRISIAAIPCTKSDIKNQKSEIPSRRHRAHPFQPLPEFAHLRPDQLEYIHDLLRDSTLADVQQQLHMDLGVRISSSTLHRYRAQLDLADQLLLGTDAQSAVDQLRALYAGRETNLDAAGLQVIKQRALALASAPKTSPTLLKDLHRIFTYEDRKQEKQQTLALRHAQRLELAHLREQTRLQLSTDRRVTEEQTLAHRQQMDLAKFQLARERHALELRKQEHREKIDAAKAPRHNPNANDEAAMRAEALLEYGRQLRRQREEAAAAAALTSNPTSIGELGTTGATASFQNHGRDAFHPRPTSISRDATTPSSAAPDAFQTLTTEQQPS